MQYSAYVQHYLDKLKAAGDPARFRLLRLLDLAGTELCICELVDILRIPQYAVSRAARALRTAGILTERREGKLVYYRIGEDPFAGHLLTLLRTIPSDDDAYRFDLDRLRWRLDIRREGHCTVTYRSSSEGASGTEKPRVLFVCMHNSARSQIAEEYLRRYGGDLFEAESAGLTPGELNPFVVESLAEEGIDISHKKSRNVFDLYRAGRTYSYVITVCSRETEENCPVFPGPVRRVNWPFADPAKFEGDTREVMERVRKLRDAIRGEIAQFVAVHGTGLSTQDHHE